MDDQILWKYIKNQSVKNNLNPYDSYVFIQQQKEHTEKLINRAFNSKETYTFVDQAILYLKSAD